MQSTANHRSWLTLILVLLAHTPLSAQALRQTGYVPQSTTQGNNTTPFQLTPLSLEELPPSLAKQLGTVLESPTLRSLGPVETFRCDPSMYYWLLQNPDQTAGLWRQIGATCANIQGTAQPGVFQWTDDQGSKVNWWLVHRTPQRHIWFAEGSVRPGALLPTVPIKAVVVSTHHEVKDKLGRTAIRHQMEMILKSNRRAAALAMRILGASAPQLAKQYVGQIEMFFAAMAWYLNENPEKAAVMFTKLHAKKTPRQ